VGRFDVAPRTLVSLTLAGEHALTRELVDRTQLIETVPVGNGFWGLSAQALPRRLPTRLALASGIDTEWGNTSGAIAQVNVAWNDRLFAVVGARAERITGFTTNAQNALLPMVGASWVTDIGEAVLKLRSAYGKGIRPANTLTRGTTWMGRAAYARASSLDPETQDGTELGADLVLGRWLTVGATRFDQRASGLVQPVASVEAYMGPNGRAVRRMTYTLENVGAITNRGWELLARSSWHGVQLVGTLALVDSRVDQLARGYGGDLRVGDRMLEVPARTYGVNALWTTRRFTVSTGVSRASDWIGYDRLAIGQVLGDPSREADLAGPRLRHYWTQYDGITQWRASTTYRVFGDWSAVVGGENLLNRQLGAPDNASVIAGRTLTLGVRAGF
jgi:iron complex outermembrane receptor protein